MVTSNAGSVTKAVIERFSILSCRWGESSLSTWDISIALGRSSFRADFLDKFNGRQVITSRLYDSKSSAHRQQWCPLVRFMFCFAHLGTFAFGENTHTLEWAMVSREAHWKWLVDGTCGEHLSHVRAMWSLFIYCREIAQEVIRIESDGRR